MIFEFFELMFATFVIKFSIRRFEIIWDKVVWIFNCHETSFLTSTFITTLLCTEWISTRMKKWLCRSFIIFNNQKLSSLLFNRFAIKKKEHLIHRLIVWRYSSSQAFFNLSSRSHIIQVFFLTSSLNFFVRSSITA
jgi:hypothetical protein